MSSSSLPPSFSIPIQAALSSNISKQTALLPLLFAAISNAASGGNVSSSKQHTVTQIFTDLARLDDELAVLMERARKHQQRWRRMEQLKRETIEVESQVRSALLVLEGGRRDLEMVVKDAKEVVSSIELAEKSESSPSELFSYRRDSRANHHLCFLLHQIPPTQKLSSLSPRLSHPTLQLLRSFPSSLSLSSLSTFFQADFLLFFASDRSFDPSRQPPSSFFPPFPSEYVLRSGKLNMGGAFGTVGETQEVTNSSFPSHFPSCPPTPLLLNLCGLSSSPLLTSSRARSRSLQPTSPNRTEWLEPQSSKRLSFRPLHPGLKPTWSRSTSTSTRIWRTIRDGVGCREGRCAKQVGRRFVSRRVFLCFITTIHDFVRTRPQCIYYERGIELLDMLRKGH